MQFKWAALVSLITCLFSFGAQAQQTSPDSMPGCIYNVTPPTLSSGQQSPWQCDVNGKLLTSVTAGSFAPQLANTVLAGPTIGSAATPTFRALVAADIPAGFALLASPTFTTPALGVATATSLAIGGCTIGSNLICLASSGAAYININGGNANLAGAMVNFLYSGTNVGGVGTQNSFFFGGTSDQIAIVGYYGLSFWTNNALSMSISMGGAVAVAGALQNTGITADTGLTDDTVCTATTTGGGGVVGQYYKGTGTLGICLGTSSARYKHDIVALDVGIDEIMRLLPVEYRLNADHGDPTKPYYGFIAEDGINVLPKLVGLDDQERPNTMDYLGIVPVLVHAVQQQQVTKADRSEVDALRAANDNLRAEVESLKQRLH